MALTLVLVWTNVWNAAFSDFSRVLSDTVPDLRVEVLTNIVKAFFGNFLLLFAYYVLRPFYETYMLPTFLKLNDLDHPEVQAEERTEKKSENVAQNPQVGVPDTLWPHTGGFERFAEAMRLRLLGPPSSTTATANNDVINHVGPTGRTGSSSSPLVVGLEDPKLDRGERSRSRVSFLDGDPGSFQKETSENSGGESVSFQLRWKKEDGTVQPEGLNDTLAGEAGKFYG